MISTPAEGDGVERTCPLCGTASVTADDIDAFGDAFLAHCSTAHGDLPYPDELKRAYGQSLARQTGPTERLDALGTVELHPVTEERIDDWLDLFDHRAFTTNIENGGCYCLEPHEIGRPAEEHVPWTDWRARRAAMVERLRAGTTFGYLAYVDGVAAGWVNASKRVDCSMFRRGDDDDAASVSVSCFAIAPPYRGHGLAQQLLAQVVADAAQRDASWVEAYPFNGDGGQGSGFRGGRVMYDAAGFTAVKVRERDTVVRRAV